MIGVIVPVHNEAERLGDCLASILAAGRHTGLSGESVRVVAVLDDCSDGSHSIAEALGVDTCISRFRNVGAARALGAESLLTEGARWLAFTDADSRVNVDWLAHQLALDADAVCGTVEVGDWDQHSPELRRRYEAGYVDADGHRHIHGANLGVSSSAYRRAGGFPPLAACEDVALVAALVGIGARIAWSAAPRVTTSARIECRLKHGFGSFIAGLRDELMIRSLPAA